jgi:hypothetical protein
MSDRQDASRPCPEWHRGRMRVGALLLRSDLPCPGLDAHLPLRPTAPNAPGGWQGPSAEGCWTDRHWPHEVPHPTHEVPLPTHGLFLQPHAL